MTGDAAGDGDVPDEDLSRPDAPMVRAWLQELRTRDAARRTLSDQLYRLYVWLALIGVPAGWLIAQALAADPAAGSVQDAIRDDLATWLPAGLVLVGLLALRLGTWRGPVVFDDADLTWLLSAPVPRGDLIRPRLIRGLAWTAGLGVVGGVVLWVVLVAELDVPPLPLLAACTSSGALVGALAAAGSWAVECRPTLARAVLRATPLVLAAVVGLALVTDELVGVAARWSGPWGWATAPVQAAAGADVAGWPIAVALLTLVTAIAVVASLQTAGSPTFEELRRRAGTARAVATGVFWMDVGAVTAARRLAVSALVGRRLRRMPVRPRRALVVPWIGAAVLLRGPWLWGRAVLLLAVGSTAGWAASSATSDELTARFAWAAVAVVCGYGAASALVEPLKVEASQRFGIRQLGRSARAVLLAHLVLPGVVLAVMAAAAGAVTAAVAGGGEVAWVAALGVAAVVPSTVVAAAYAALREPPDPTVILLYGETGIAMYASQSMVGPGAALVVGLVPVASFAGAVDGGVSPGSALVTAGTTALALGGVAVVLLRQWLGSRA
ncbi:DUF6297 family protein [Euzebya sp.]|uniref:DUF6297 family protein n=1 Tax=Euzebya sp. TaxID=1971409 RepID=UPI0035112EF5